MSWLTIHLDSDITNNNKRNTGKMERKQETNFKGNVNVKR